MSITTAFTELLAVRHPVVLAPMAEVAGGELAAAVSNAGGLGLVGGGRAEPAWLDRELTRVTELTDRPWGVGFQTWATTPETVDRALAHRPAALMLSFGDPGPYADRVHEAGALLITQVTNVEEARRALDVGADVIVAQGTEAGGHGGGRSTLPFVPVVVDLAGRVPVLAAGGIADGRGLAAALALGASGALLGTRFQATTEAHLTPRVAEALVAAGAEDTERSRVLDIVRATGWPEQYTARTLRNPYLDRWRGREDELRADLVAQRDYQVAEARGDTDAVPVWAGEGVDLITDIPGAGELVDLLVAEAERAIDQLRTARGTTGRTTA